MTPVFARLCAVLRRFSLGKKSFTVAALGYIAAADAEGGGDLPLSQGHCAAQSVAQADDLRLPGCQVLPDQTPQLQGAVPVVDVVQHGVVYTHDVHQLQGVALLVGLDGL
jgi:hypothetical protein